MSIYKAGLNRKKEAVISAHFMHQLNQDVNLMLYSPAEFSGRTLTLKASLISANLIPSLLAASDEFIKKRAAAARTRAKDHFKEYGLSSPEQISLTEIITEVMFDRQFLKGPKSNCSRCGLAQLVNTFVTRQEPVKMLIPALPYKSSSPLKSRGVMPDLSEINFLLGLAEIVKTISLIYKEEIPAVEGAMAKFTVISDGTRFNVFLNEPDKIIKAYQTQLRWWINKLNIMAFVEIADYQYLIEHNLPQELYRKKQAIKEQVYQQYDNLMAPLLNPCDMAYTLTKAIASDPDPESWHPEGRFIPLFKSLIYIIKYKILDQYTRLHPQHYAALYAELTRHIFEPYTKLSENDLAHIKTFIANPQQNHRPTQVQCYEYLRQAMLNEAWLATMNYIAEIRSDRDLPLDPVSTCFPDNIRWTIHAKSGQMAILITTASGDPIQPWHGAGVFKLTKNNKIKIYAMPALLLEGEGATPVLIANDEAECMIKDQPLFYIHQDVHYKNATELLHIINSNLTRNRKF